MVLTYLMARVSPELGLRLGILHVDHGIRGYASKRDAMFVKDVSMRLSIPFFLEELNLGNNVTNLEEHARLGRYRAITRCMRDNKFRYAATGHTMDDQAETLIFRLVRGSGLRGMEGIHFKREDGIIRPLLGLTREQISSYARENNIDHVEDETNRDTHFARNLIRHEVIPLIKRINPGVITSTARFANVVREENQVLEAMAGELIKDAAELDWGIIKVFNLEGILKRPPAVVKRFVIGVVSNLLAEARGIDSIQVGMIMDVVNGKRSAHNIKRLIRVTRWKNTVVFHAAGPRPFYTLEVRAPGDIYVKEINRTLGVEFKEGEKGPVTIRSWLPGDMMEGRKVSQILYSMGVMSPIRQFWPVIVSRGKVIGMAGMDSERANMVFK